MNNTCFVIMPIGTQTIGETIITEKELREKYDHIIKNAVLKADPTLEVIRSDDEVDPGSISNDILTKLMHSRYVIADITYPNPNVFYELGLRHAIRTGTTLIREKCESSIPFDISHLRYTEYTSDITGMDKLAIKLKRRFEFFEKNPQKPDNQFLELCSVTNYLPIMYSDPTKKANDEFITNMLTMVFSNPDMLKALSNGSLSQEEQKEKLLTELSNDPDYVQQFIKGLIGTGLVQF